MRGFLGERGKDFELYEYLAFSLSVALLSLSLSLPLRGEIWTNLFFGTIHKQSNSGDFSAMGKPYCGGGWAEKITLEKNSGELALDIIKRTKYRIFPAFHPPLPPPYFL